MVLCFFCPSSSTCNHSSQIATVQKVMLVSAGPLGYDHPCLGSWKGLVSEHHGCPRYKREPRKLGRVRGVAHPCEG